ncbi:MAG: hypothetical protein LBS42_10680 [Tannerella sp.]|jgi:hypothetical protein|nr:hypothetical protein [Tannerella sp.]
MKEIKNEYVKRTQKDYRMSFNLSVVWEIERSEVSVTNWSVAQMMVYKEKRQLLIG